ncbi:hypothetical protein BDY19DRAFT_964943 [Irpex rosettiformis]|uniref:Uncharacterized protein n=1 Tax=Irpex rosettiformis TaxID=378272 RepID=A0ACB8TUU3_9APHY|nr:hypothetical protein BDY19DRAFT_964943 [Irpex rosettiformis]
MPPASSTPSLLLSLSLSLSLVVHSSSCAGQAMGTAKWSPEHDPRIIEFDSYVDSLLCTCNSDSCIHRAECVPGEAVEIIDRQQLCRPGNNSSLNDSLAQLLPGRVWPVKGTDCTSS